MIVIPKKTLLSITSLFVFINFVFLGIGNNPYNSNNNFNDGYTPEILWYYDLDAPSFGSAAIGDIDGDNNLEIVFGTYFNDEHVYALNAESGTLLWKYDTGGCNDASPAIADVDLDGENEVIIPSSSPYTVYCFNGATGSVEWSTSTGYPNCIDSPPAVADVDNDEKPEVILGTWYGYVFCLNGEDGSICWQTNLGSDSYFQSGPNIVDLDNDGQLDVVVAQYSGDQRIYALKGDDASILWYSDLPQDDMYHGGSFADIDEDGKPEIVIGSYDDNVYVLNGEDGSLLWYYSAPISIASPTSIADLNNDGHLEIVFTSYNILGVLSHTGVLQWSYSTGGSLFRGASITDTNDDGILDVVFGSDDGILRILNGNNGTLVWSIDLEEQYGDTYQMDHAPTIADFDNNGELDIFIIGGYGTSSGSENNHGRAYALTAGGGTGPSWPMFRHDLRHSACFGILNQAPVALDDYAHTTINCSITLNITSNDFDEDGSIDTSTVEIIDNPNNGSLDLNQNNGIVTYIPDTNFYGLDSFQYAVDDNLGCQSNEASVYIFVLKNDINLREIPLSTGWNLITIPVENDWMASDLANNVTGCLSVNKWDAVNQSYRGYIVGIPAFDFPIVDGCGYFVEVDQPSVLYLTGTNVTTVNIPFKIAWNIIGWYDEYNTTASSLAENITGCLSVNKWDAVNQSYRGYIVGIPAFDFTISRGMGIFLEVSEESTWHGEG